MLILRAALLWALMSINIVGAAVLFRRLFPRECPWFGFFVFPFTFVFVFNCLEHFVALPHLGWLLPITTLGFAWLLMRKDYSWDGLRLPTTIFLLAFAFSFAIKCLRPDISTNSEGMEDLKRVLDFSVGETLPPTDGWLPPYPFAWYYNLQHYAASVVERLFDLDIGTAYNLCLPLLIALTATVGAGAAYSFSGQRTWIAFLTLFLIESTFTGSSAYVDVMTYPNPNVWVGVMLTAEWDNHATNPLWWFLTDAKDKWHFDSKLHAPGLWNWMDEFHSNLLGHFLMLSSVLASSELFRPNRSNWPWIWLLFLPVLTIISSTWVIFMIAFLCVGALGIGLATGQRPADFKLIIMVLLAFGALLWPTIFYFTSVPGSDANSFHTTPDYWHTPFWQFPLQWWPVYVPWIVLCFFWHRLDAQTRWYHFAFLAMSLFVEYFSLSNQRMLTTEKMWGPLYGFALVTMMPLMFTYKGWPFRVFNALILLCAAISLWGWLSNTWKNTDLQQGSFQLEGDSYILRDPAKKRMIQVLTPLHTETLLAGVCGWEYDGPPALAVFTGNRCYIAWYTATALFGRSGEAQYRWRLNNEFYAGKMANPLGFLLDNNIAAVIIWPGDSIPDETLNPLKQQLAPAYNYIDCRIDADSGEIVPGNNAGIFMRRASFHPTTSVQLAPAVNGPPPNPTNGAP